MSDEYQLPSDGLETSHPKSSELSQVETSLPGQGGFTKVETQTTQDIILTNLQDRLAFYTKPNGIQEVLKEYDKPDGDWQTIKSENPFEVLFLDYQQFDLITPELVYENYHSLKAYWHERYLSWSTGSQLIHERYERKYGKEVLSQCLQTLDIAFEKLRTEDGVNKQFGIINKRRLNTAENLINAMFEIILADDEVDGGEMRMVFKKVNDFNVSDEECASIVEKILNSKGILSKGEPKGDTLKEKLLSVKWMTKEKLQEELKDDETRAHQKVKILGKYANDTEEMGQILFENPSEAKKIIKENLLKQAVSTKDVDAAYQIGLICEEISNADLSFLAIVYKLCPSLPFRITPDLQAESPSEFARIVYSSEQLFQTGKEHLEKGFLEVWLKERDNDLLKKLKEIILSSENKETAYLKTLLLFDSTLPYRLMDGSFAASKEELVALIDKNSTNWELGKQQLYNTLILIWLSGRNELSIVEKWTLLVNNEKYGIKNEPNVGLEEFLHLLNPKLPNPVIKIKPIQIDVPKIQIGKIQSVDIHIENGSRGYLKCDLILTDNIKGVSLSKKQIFSGPHWPDKMQNVVLTIDSTELIKGKQYKSNISIKSNIGDPIKIPLTFKVVFPKTAFIRELIKYSIFFTLLGVCFRSLFYFIGAGSWLNSTFSYYILYQDISWNKTDLLSRMPIIFLLFIVGVFFLLKYWKRIGNVLRKIK